MVKNVFFHFERKKKHTWSGRLKLLLLTLKSLHNFGTIPITFVINKPIFFLLFTIAPLILYWFSKVPLTCFDSLSCQNLYMHTILYPHKFKFSSVLLKNIVSPNKFSSPWKLSLFSFNSQQTSLTYYHQIQKVQTYKIVANIELGTKSRHGIAYHPFLIPKISTSSNILPLRQQHNLW